MRPKYEKIQIKYCGLWLILAFRLTFMAYDLKIISSESKELMATCLLGHYIDIYGSLLIMLNIRELLYAKTVATPTEHKIPKLNAFLSFIKKKVMT